MKEKELVVVSLEASPDGQPFVLVSLADPTSMKANAIQSHRLGGFWTPPQRLELAASRIRVSLTDYEESDLKVGDVVVIGFEKVGTTPLLDGKQEKLVA
ncbi:MAG: hypothetical protein ABSB53_03795 [Nitrososphaerales archaeon]